MRTIAAVLVACLIGATGCTSEPDTAAATDPLSSWNETPAKQSIVDFVERVTTPTPPTSSPRPTASPCSTTTARCGPRPRCRSRRRRVRRAETPRAHRAGAGGRPVGAGGVEGGCRTDAGVTGTRGYARVGIDPYRNDDRRVQRAGLGMDVDREASPFRPTLRRTHLPAAAAVAGPSAGQRFPHLHRLGRRR